MTPGGYLQVAENETRRTPNRARQWKTRVVNCMRHSECFEQRQLLFRWKTSPEGFSNPTSPTKPPIERSHRLFVGRASIHASRGRTIALQKGSRHVGQVGQKQQSCVDEFTCKANLLRSTCGARDHSNGRQDAIYGCTCRQCSSKAPIHITSPKQLSHDRTARATSCAGIAASDDDEELDEELGVASWDPVTDRRLSPRRQEESLA